MADPVRLAADARDMLAPWCPSCGWSRGQHRPAAPSIGLEPCPEAARD